MRISDWSSDVCSSDLIRWLFVNWLQSDDIKLLLQRADGSLEGALRQLRERLPSEFQDLFDKLGRRHRATEQGRANIFLANLANALDPGHFDRSEEHTSELQSLMRISYAVFCLKKKKTSHTNTNHTKTI